MYRREQTLPFKCGLWSCWTAMLMVPVGMIQLSGANTLLHSIILVCIGSAAILGAILGIALVSREILENRSWHSKGVLCACGATFAAVLGCLYLAAGFLSTVEHLK